MKAINVIRKYGSKAALAATAAAMPVLAMANENAMVTAATTELNNGKAAVAAIGPIVIGIAVSVVVVGLVIKLARRGG
ncbi:major capsid protein [Neisseria dentiae]|uniref:major capsid protein n=1 Tax=Neisseria dentiae TaxID=194197 RepID=UPI00359F374F